MAARSALLIALFALLAVGCDSSEDEVDVPFLPQDARYVYSVDNRFIETDSVVFSLNETVRLRTTSRNASVPGYEGLIELVADLSGSGTQRTWYERTPERLREVAYSVSSLGGVVRPRGVAVTPDVFGLPRSVAALMDRHRPAAGGGEEDSVIVREEPRVVYEFPLEVGASWVSFSDVFLSTREVVGREEITVAAGTFDCFVIRTEIDADLDVFDWLDYVSEERGLVLRTMYLVGRGASQDSDAGPLFRSIERLATDGRAVSAAAGGAYFSGRSLFALAPRAHASLSAAVPRRPARRRARRGADR